jgi:hypothetical protein
MLCSDMVLAGLNYGWYSRMVDYQLTLLILVTTSLGGIIIELFCQVIKLLKLWGNDFIPETDEAKHNGAS